MSFLGGLYFFKDWHGIGHLWTAKRLYKRVVKDADNCNWITSVTELVKVLKKPNFPEDYSKKIKVVILKSFTNFENDGRLVNKNITTTDEEAVYYCYNTLNISEEAVINAKREYFKAIVFKASRKPNYANSFYLKGEAYLTLREEWRNEKLNEFVFEKEIHFKQLLKELKDEFTQKVREAEKAGTFKADDDKLREDVGELFYLLIEVREDTILD